MEKKEVWSPADIIKNRNNWSLASDAELLKCLQSLSQKLVEKSQSALTSLDSLKNDVNETCISVSNVSNRLRGLSDTQFIESKVQDDAEVSEPSTSVQEKKPVEGDIATKLKNALDNGIQVLRSQYDIIAVTDSDSEDNETQEVLLKSRNPYMNRRLPFIIGTDEFTRFDHLGLASSSEEDEDEEEEEHDELEKRIDTSIHIPESQLQPRLVEESAKSRLQIIQISSDSELSSEEDSKTDEKSPEVSMNSFQDHLNNTLKSTSTIPPYIDDIFSPPPFPTKGTNDLIDDEDSDSSSSSDIFSSSKKICKPSENKDVAKSMPDSNEEKTSLPPLDRKILSSAGEKSPISHSRESSATSDVSISKSDSSPAKTTSSTKPFINKNLFNALNQELNVKLKKNMPAKVSDSSEDDSCISKTFSSSERSSKIPDVKPRNDSSKIDSKNSISTSDELLKAPTAKTSTSKSDFTNKKPQKPNTVAASLFDDDDSMDELFQSRDQLTKVNSANDRNKKVFAVDEKEKDTRSHQASSSVSSLLNEKLDIFGDDSDSEDDIFAIINSQKKKKPIEPEIHTSSSKSITDVRTKPKSKLFDSDDSDDSMMKKAGISTPLENISDDDLFTTSIKNVSTKKEKSKVESGTAVSSKLGVGDEGSYFSRKNISEPYRSNDNLKFEKEEKILGSENFFEDVEDEVSFPNENQKSEPVSDSVIFGDEGPQNVVKTRNEKKNEASNEKLSKLKNTLDENKHLDIVSKSSSIKIDNEVMKSDLFISESDDVGSLSKKPVSTMKLTLRDESQSTDDQKNLDRLPSDSTTSISSVNVSEGKTDKTEKKLSAPFPTSKEMSLDDGDGGSISKKGTHENAAPVSTSVPGKLAANRGLKINVNALLPGSSWSKQVKSTSESLKPAEIQGQEIVVAPTIENGSSNKLPNIIKNRAKITSRRPPSRRARINNITNRDIFSPTAGNVTDDEHDGSYKTASESNSPETNNVKERDPKQVKKNGSNKVSPSVISKEDVSPLSEDIFGDIKTNAPLPSLSKESFKKPPRAPRTLVAKPAPLNPPFPSTPISNDGNTSETRVKNEYSTASHLENDLVSASETWEPPAFESSDSKNLISDSDDDDIFSDALRMNDSDESDTDLKESSDVPNTKNFEPEQGTSLESDNIPPPFKTSSKLLFPTRSTVTGKLTSELFSFPAHGEKNEDIITASSSKTESQTNTDFVPETKKDSKNLKTETSDYTKELTKKISYLFADDNDDDDDDDLDFFKPSRKAHTSKNIETEYFDHSNNVPATKSSSVSSNVEKQATDLLKTLNSDSDDDLDDIFSKVSKPKTDPSVETEKPREVKNTSIIQETKVKNNEPQKFVQYTSDLFLDPESDGLFTKMSSHMKSETRSEKSNDVSNRDIDNMSIIANDDSLFKTSKTDRIENDVKKQNLKPKITSNIFGDEEDNDDLFVLNKKPVLKSKAPSKGIFDDNDDDDDLFGAKVSPAVKNSAEPVKKSVQSNISGKARVVKRRSETVVIDPLSGGNSNK